MPRHKQVTTCRRGGPVSNRCSCEHCTLAVCSVCGAWEGGLTTDCPGAKVSFDRQQEVYETRLDYTDDRGWHQGEKMIRRSPNFEAEPPKPQPSPPPDPRAIVEPSVDWARIDRMTDLEHELGLRAFAWVIADRIADDHVAAHKRVEDEIKERVPAGHVLTEADLDLHAKLEREKIEAQIACRRADACDDEFRQAARRLVAELEKDRP